MIPPIFINNLPWSKGYFETVANVPLNNDDLFKNHVFWNPMAKRQFYVDQYNQEIKSKLPWKYGFFEKTSTGKSMKLYESFSPVGFSALSSYRSFDDRISNILGISLSE